MSSPDLADISFRLATPDDAKLLESLARETWALHYTPIIGAEQVAYMLDSFQSEEAIIRDMQNGYIYEIAFHEEMPCGYCAVRNDEDHTFFLSKLYVLASQRGRGIARTFVDHVIDRAQQASVNRIRLTCNKRNTGSLTAYARMGFAISGECATSIGGGFVMDDFILELLI
jgi:GNAT superfamily N-acetyltransferase